VYGRSFNSKEYVKIFENYYDFPVNSEPRLTAYASKECIYGAIPPGHPDFNTIDHKDRGFVGTASGCELYVNLKMNANYIGVSLNNRAIKALMELNYMRLGYYSFQRVEVGYMSFYINGNVKPDGYSMNTDVYDIAADDSKYIEFTIDDVTPNNISVGSLHGYRIFYANSPAGLVDVLGGSAQYLTQDVVIPGGQNKVTVPISTAVMPAMARKTAYYFKIVAIRENSNYDAGAFPGLDPGLYLSEGDFPVLRVVVPEFNHVYMHDLQVMVERDALRDGGNLYGPFDHSQAMDACAAEPKLNIADGGSAVSNRPYKLITKPVWDELRADPFLSTYTGGENYLQIPHWLDSPGYDISTYFGGYVGYNSFENDQAFPLTNEYYFRCSDGCLNDRMMGGGFLGQSFSDYISFVGETIPLGYARCYLDTSQ
jgi:hypothetical protein